MIIVYITYSFFSRIGSYTYGVSDSVVIQVDITTSGDPAYYPKLLVSETFLLITCKVCDVLWYHYPGTLRH